jgi:hypothetical protein
MLFFVAVFAVSAFSADWYARGNAYEKCMYMEDGILVCRENYVRDYCYGKEKAWLGRKLISVRNLNHKCEYNGWTRFRLVDDTWIWKCYLNNREMEDSACKGFRKR